MEDKTGAPYITKQEHHISQNRSTTHHKTGAPHIAKQVSSRDVASLVRGVPFCRLRVYCHISILLELTVITQHHSSDLLKIYEEV